VSYESNLVYSGVTWLGYHYWSIRMTWWGL